MAGAHHTRGAVHVEARVQVAGHERLPGVDADSNSNRLALPGVLGQRALRPRRGVHRLTRICEREVERIALHLDFDSSVCRERLPQQAAVVLERAHVRLLAQLLEQPRRALDIGEEQRDRAAR